MREIEVTRTYLQLVAPDELRPGKAAAASFVRRAPCTVQLYRELYCEVGELWHWRDRLAWSDDQLAQYLASPDVRVWELQVDGDPAGYFELHRHTDGSVEIVYFGLMSRYIGRGLGGAMLTRAVREGWAMDANRVWLHTCTLDSPHALPNYMARGFRKFRQETYTTALPDI